jgi:hypothetical protein
VISWFQNVLSKRVNLYRYVAGMKMATDDVYKHAVKILTKFSSSEVNGGAYVGELREGLTPSSRCVKYVAADPSHAFVMTRELRAWEGVSWPAVGLPPVPPPASSAAAAAAGANGEGAGGGGDAVEGVVVDIPDAAAAGAMSLRAPPKQAAAAAAEEVAAAEEGAEAEAAVEGGGEEKDAPSRPAAAPVVVPLVPISAPGAYFAAPFAGGKHRGFVALDTVGGGAGGGPLPASDKALAARVAAAVSSALAAGAVARDADIAAYKEATLKAFDSEEATAARAAAYQSAKLEAEEQEGKDTA